jgi:hypothetical protein
MTRKDYVLLAIALSESRPAALTDPIAFTQWRTDVRVLGIMLKEENQRFDLKRFEAACNVRASS